MFTRQELKFSQVVKRPLQKAREVIVRTEISAVKFYMARWFTYQEAPIRESWLNQNPIRTQEEGFPASIPQLTTY